jgi:hypothetical protein
VFTISTKNNPSPLDSTVDLFMKKHDKLWTPFVHEKLHKTRIPIGYEITTNDNSKTGFINVKIMDSS